MISSSPVRFTSIREVEALSRVHTRTAINTLLEVCENKDAPSAARVAAAEAILSRGWGRPQQRVVVEAEAEHLSDEQLAEAIFARLSGFARGSAQRPQAGQIVDGECTEAGSQEPPALVQ